MKLEIGLEPISFLYTELILSRNSELFMLE